MKLPGGWSIDPRRKSTTMWDCPICGHLFLTKSRRDAHARKHKRRR